MTWLRRIKRDHVKRLARIVLITLVSVLLLGLAVVLTVLSSRPPRTDFRGELFQGVTYLRWARSTPRPLMIHVIEIDLRAAGIHFLVTPSDNTCGLDICAMTTSDFVDKYDVQVAVNGSFFEPFHSQDYTVSDYYPHTGEGVDVWGLAISNGTMYSQDDARYAKLCLTAQSVQISDTTCPSNTTQALAGSSIILENGAVVDFETTGVLHPRTAAAISADGKHLWLIVVDGRQDGYSEGVTPDELAGIALELGATTALNLDGGGSSTMVVSGPMGIRSLNSPIHTRIPMRQRPVANHLGVYALPLIRP